MPVGWVAGASAGSMTGTRSRQAGICSSGRLARGARARSCASLGPRSGSGRRWGPCAEHHRHVVTARLSGRRLSDRRALLLGQGGVRPARRVRPWRRPASRRAMQAGQDPAVAVGVEQRQGEALVAAGLLERVVAHEADPAEGRPRCRLQGRGPRRSGRRRPCETAKTLSRWASRTASRLRPSDPRVRPSSRRRAGRSAPCHEGQDEGEQDDPEDRDDDGQVVADERVEIDRTAPSGMTPAASRVLHRRIPRARRPSVVILCRWRAPAVRRRAPVETPSDHGQARPRQHHPTRPARSDSRRSRPRPARATPDRRGGGARGRARGRRSWPRSTRPRPPGAARGRAASDRRAEPVAVGRRDDRRARRVRGVRLRRPRHPPHRDHRRRAAGALLIGLWVVVTATGIGPF